MCGLKEIIQAQKSAPVIQLETRTASLNNDQVVIVQRCSSEQLSGAHCSVQDTDCQYDLLDDGTTDNFKFKYTQNLKTCRIKKR